MKPVYTLEDLESRELLDAGADKPARLAVIGHPVAHSASPRMHQPALDAEGIDARYIRLDLEPTELGVAFARMRELDFIGCNVTVPHKFEAMALCNVVHPDAKVLGAVNTVHFHKDQTLGFNTDGPGFARAIEDDFQVDFSSLRVAVIGAGGGAGGAIATQCILSGVRGLVLVNRSFDKLNPLAAKLAKICPSCEITTLSFDGAALVAECLGCDLIVNTTSVGLKPGDACVLPSACLRKGHLVYDTIYQPPVTPLLKLAKEHDCRTANGLSMLIHQGALAFQHWFPGTEPFQVMKRALQET